MDPGRARPGVIRRSHDIGVSKGSWLARGKSYLSRKDSFLDSRDCQIGHSKNLTQADEGGKSLPFEGKGFPKKEKEFLNF